MGKLISLVKLTQIILGCLQFGNKDLNLLFNLIKGIPIQLVRTW